MCSVVSNFFLYSKVIIVIKSDIIRVSDLQFQQSNGNFDPHCPSNDLPSSFVYLRDPTIRCSTESSKNSSGPNPCVTGTKTSCVLQKEQLRHNPYVVQPNTSVFEQSSPDELNSTRSRQQKSQQTVSSNELTQSSLFPGNPVINPSVWSSWESVNKLLPENRVTTSQSYTSGKSQNFNPHSQTNVALPIPILSNSAMSDGHSEIHVHSECPQSSIHTLSTDSRKAAVTHKIGPLITLAGGKTQNVEVFFIGIFRRMHVDQILLLFIHCHLWILFYCLFLCFENLKYLET